jgi:hypothetical protein
MDTTFRLPNKSFKERLKQARIGFRIAKNHIENAQEMAASEADIVKEFVNETAKEFDKMYQEVMETTYQFQEIYQSRESSVIKQIPFMQRFTEIRRHGNNVRKTIVPETDSPANENVTKEMLVGTGRFFEAGR